MSDQSPSTELAPERVGYAAISMNSVGAGGGSLSVQTLGEAVGFAAVMARADIALPKHLRGNQGACLAVTMQAMRWEMDPFAVANKTYSVNDRLAYEAQLVAAVVVTRAPIARRPDYTYSGAGNTRACTVTIEMRDGTIKEYTTPQFGQITTKNSPLWKSDPDQQLGYFAIRSWARRHAPEVLLGVYTPDEILDNPDIVRNVTPGRQPTGLAARLEANKGADSVEGFNAATREAQRAEDVAQAAAAGEQVDADTGEVSDAAQDAPQADGEATGGAGLPPDEDPAEALAAWLAEAPQLIDAAADKAALDMLNEAWVVEGRWDALKAYSKADHTGLLRHLLSRQEELAKAEAVKS